MTSEDHVKEHWIPYKRKGSYDKQKALSHRQTGQEGERKEEGENECDERRGGDKERCFSPLFPTLPDFPLELNLDTD